MDHLILSYAFIARYIYVKKLNLQTPKSIYVSYLVLVLMTFMLFNGKEIK